MSWGEVAQLGLRYGKIPLALLAVEALYWFITQPSDTLALIQYLHYPLLVVQLSNLSLLIASFDRNKFDQPL